LGRPETHRTTLYDTHLHVTPTELVGHGAANEAATDYRDFGSVLHVSLRIQRTGAEWE
jgi:hypothetical protein